MAGWEQTDTRMWTAIMNNQDEYDYWSNYVAGRYDMAMLTSKFSRRDMVVNEIANKIRERYRLDRLVGIGDDDSKRFASLELHGVAFAALQFISIASQMVTTFEKQRNMEAARCL